MTINHVKVFAPATIANIGPGFDVLGIAIDQPGDIVIAERRAEKGLKFSVMNNVGDVPVDFNNVAAHVAKLMLEELDPSFGVSMVLQKNMPQGSGLGSSGASCAAAVVAINALLQSALEKKDLVRFAMEGEKLAAGSAHADNVAPSIMGGACLIRSYQPLDIIQLPVKNIFYWVVVHPQLIIFTETARELLPEKLFRKIAVQQCGNLGALITGLITGDSVLIGNSLQDVIAEPVRAPLIPGYDDVKKSALDAGAIGFSISGSGPSVFAITSSLSVAEHVAASIKQAFKHYAKIDSEAYISRINQEGAKILEQSS